MDRRDFIGYGVAFVALGLAGRPAEAGQMRIPLDAALRRFANARRAAGLAVPSPDPALRETARRQVLHMAGHCVASHMGAAGAPPDARARDAGFAGRLLGEALAETRDGADETMAFWLSHAATREVLMDDAADRFGLAAVAGQDGRAWWLLATGTSRPPRGPGSR